MPQKQVLELGTAFGGGLVSEIVLHSGYKVGTLLLLWWYSGSHLGPGEVPFQSAEQRILAGMARKLRVTGYIEESRSKRF